MVWTKRNKTAFSIIAVFGVLALGWISFTLLDKL